jgi:hypothetical protein
MAIASDRNRLLEAERFVARLDNLAFEDTDLVLFYLALRHLLKRLGKSKVDGLANQPDLFVKRPDHQVPRVLKIPAVGIDVEAFGAKHAPVNERLLPTLGDHGAAIAPAVDDVPLQPCVHPIEQRRVEVSAYVFPSRYRYGLSRVIKKDVFAVGCESLDRWFNATGRLYGDVKPHFLEHAPLERISLCRQPAIDAEGPLIGLNS